MTAFDRLHSAVQYHIVNSLGWQRLWPLQERSIEPILGGDNVILCAPTAGGKTEAAIFPLLSRMMEEDWSGLSLLYLCPLKALLNNLEPRLHHYFQLVGRRVELWHGDVGSSGRSKIEREPPDLLLTTPESVEVILTSRRRSLDLLGHVHAVVVDELHAFAGDDRGWHLWSVLQRVAHLSGCDLQRVALSATVGNPDSILRWLSGRSDREQTAVVVPATGEEQSDVKIDYVGDLENAAHLVHELHRGEKRLVFCDSRAQVEDLAFELRERRVETFVSHSSLSVDERRAAERAFAEGSNCVIVSTSTLELGLDVGDLDRVVQIGAPTTVSSFLQRLGRTGRRAGRRPNLLFLALTPDHLLQAAGLVNLWREGWIEDVQPPPLAYHILAQQLLCLVLQRPGLPRPEWSAWLGGGQEGLASLPRARDLLDHLIETGYLYQDSGRLSFGAAAEDRFAGKRRLDIYSAFTTAPLFTVLFGNRELGHVAPSSFHQPGRSEPVILLAGRSWRVTHIDWSEGRAYAEPAKAVGRSVWPGSGLGLSYEVCQSIRSVLTEQPGLPLTERASTSFESLLDSFAFVEKGHTALLQEGPSRWCWWTFGGHRANGVLAEALRSAGGSVLGHDDLSIALASDANPSPLLRKIEIDETQTAWLTEEVTEILKFAELLPPGLARGIVAERFSDRALARRINLESTNIILTRHAP